MFGLFGSSDARLDKAARQLEEMTRLLDQSRAVMKNAEATIHAQRARLDSLERAYLDRTVRHASEVQQWQSAVRDGQQQNEDDARRIVAYQRWCAENDCVPTDADMERLSR